MRFPPNLCEALRRGEAVLVTGLRCGTLAGRPNWPTLLRGLTSHLGEEDARAVRALLARENWSLALAAVSERLGPELAAQLLAETEGVPGGQMPAVFPALCQVPFRAVVTTALADTWERALTEAREAPTVLSAGASLEVGGDGTGPVLIHALGRAAMPETLCLSPLDLPAKVVATGLDDLLADLARNLSFVFVGFEPGDLDLEWVAGRLLGKALGEQPHFILNIQGPATAAFLRSCYGLEPLSSEGPLGDALVRFTREALIASGRSEQDAELVLERARAEVLPEEPVATPAPVEGAVPNLEWGSRSSEVGATVETTSGERASDAPASPLAGEEARAGTAELSPGTADLVAVGEGQEQAAPQPIEIDSERVAEMDAREARAIEAQLCVEMIGELEQHTVAERWREAATVLERLLALEEDPAARARYLHAQALVHRRVSGDRSETQAFLERALEEDADLAPAWDGLERLHREAGDGPALRRCHLRRLKRVASRDRALSARLLGRLAESARQDLGDRATAVAALEAARALGADDREERNRPLAELYLELGPSSADKAIAEHQSLVAQAPDSVPPYRILARLWSERGQHARSAFALAALAYLEERGAERPRAAKATKGRAAVAPRVGKLTEATLKEVAHPDDDLLLGDAFALVARDLADLCARPVAAFRAERGEPVRLSEKHDPGLRPIREAGARPERFAACAMLHAAEVMDVSAPDLYLVDSQPGPLSIEGLTDGGRFSFALLAQKSVATGSEAELLFAFSHLAALLRDRTLIRFPLASPESLALGFKVMQGLGKIPIDSVERTVRTAITRLRRRLDTAALARLEGLARTLASRPAEPQDLQRWVAASDLTAARAALVVTGDLGAALTVIGRQQTTRPGALAPAERIKDLLCFAVSERHFEARRAVGLEGPGAGGASVRSPLEAETPLGA